MAPRVAFIHLAWTLFIILFVTNLLVFLTKRGLQMTCIAGRCDTEIPGADCNPGIPCEYPDLVDFRVIIITYNRAASLAKLLATLDQLEMDGDTAALEIWIDVMQGNNSVDEETVKTATSFKWSRGTTRVHVQKNHVGNKGQWVYTWRPKGDELGIILEDDLSVSPFIYRWLKSAHNKFGTRPDVAGYTIQSEGVSNFVDMKPVSGPKNDTVYMFRTVGTWGYAPNPRIWRAFQDWYKKVRYDPGYHPYIEKAPILTKWCKYFEKKKEQDNFWEVWFDHYCDINDLFSVYNNLRVSTRNWNLFLSANRKERGLHFNKKRPDNSDKLMSTWSDSYVDFPDQPARYDWGGEPLQKTVS